MALVSFAFVQGVAAFFAPCAVALLPGYIINLITKRGDVSDIYHKVFSAIKVWSAVMAGVLIVYGFASIGIVLVASRLKAWMPCIATGMGIILIGMGVVMLAGKHFELMIKNKAIGSTSDTLVGQAFSFGITFAIGALGCLFPLFLVVATQAIGAQTRVQSGLILFSYFGGMGLMLAGGIIGSAISSEMVRRWLRIILPYMDTITAILVVIGGIYVIRYQSSLL